jgi:hypothetical protein
MLTGRQIIFDAELEARQPVIYPGTLMAIDSRAELGAGLSGQHGTVLLHNRGTYNDRVEGSGLAVNRDNTMEVTVTEVTTRPRTGLYHERHIRTAPLAIEGQDTQLTPAEAKNRSATVKKALGSLSQRPAAQHHDDITRGIDTARRSARNKDTLWFRWLRWFKEVD